MIRGHLARRLIFAFVLVLLIPRGAIGFYRLNSAGNTPVGKMSAQGLQSVSPEASASPARLLNVRYDVVFLSEAFYSRRYLPGLTDPNSGDQTTVPQEVSFFQSFLTRSPQSKDITVLTVESQETRRVVNGTTLTPGSVAATPRQEEPMIALMGNARPD